MDCLTAGLEYRKTYYTDGTLNLKKVYSSQSQLCLLKIKLIYQELINDK